MNDEDSHRRTVSGRYSPLRYPGGKGKLARFMRDVVRLNGLSDGHYVEPFAGGAAIAWELLLTGIVKRVTINDINRPVYAFWRCVVEETEELNKRILETEVSLSTWDRCKATFNDADNQDDIDVAFAFFFLNRTNRSGILNAGVIGGRDQTGKWKIDARYNKQELVQRISKIAAYGSKITVCQEDAVDFLASRANSFSKKTLIYIDPPYYEKGRHLYYDYYRSDDHTQIADAVQAISDTRWIVSYDDVRPIHDLYEPSSWMQYTINYSARNKLRGREAMFFSEGLEVPQLEGTMIELDRGEGYSGDDGIPANDRIIHALPEKLNMRKLA
ncbi:MAG: DNA adenine methylase [Hyphomonas sp.]|uniref:DNA adenine methylase n=1 Tax=Hyphomonas sp. TaxID=87 RepID=UPI003003510B